MMEREKLRNAEGETGRRLKENPSCCLHQPGGWLQGRQSKALLGRAQAKVQEAMDTSCNKVIDIRKQSS